MTEHPSGAADIEAARSVRDPGRRFDPERTRGLILAAAREEFAAKGSGGARVDEIAARAGVNKRMLYHYFGDKQQLYLAVLDDIYAEIRAAETNLHLETLEPAAAMQALIEFSFDYYTDHPHFIRLLNNENLLQARNVRGLTGIRQRTTPLVGLISDILARGQRSGSFRSDVDPVQLYISIAGLGYFYFSNIHTLSEIFGTELASGTARASRRKHVTEMVLSFLRPTA